MAQPDSRSAARAHPVKDRGSLYEEITSKIIAELEVAGRLPWVQPWGSAGVRAPLGLPKNAATGRTYSGINVLILWASVVENGFAGQSWLTYRQAAGLGGQHRRHRRRPTICWPSAIAKQRPEIWGKATLPPAPAAAHSLTHGQSQRQRRDGELRDGPDEAGREAPGPPVADNRRPSHGQVTTQDRPERIA